MNITTSQIIDHILNKKEIPRWLFNKSSWNIKSKSEIEILMDLIEDLKGNLIIALLKDKGVKHVMMQIQVWLNKNNASIESEISKMWSLGSNDREYQERAIETLKRLIKY